MRQVLKIVCLAMALWGISSSCVKEDLSGCPPATPPDDGGKIEARTLKLTFGPRQMDGAYRGGFEAGPGLHFRQYGFCFHDVEAVESGFEHGLRHRDHTRYRHLPAGGVDQPRSALQTHHRSGSRVRHDLGGDPEPDSGSFVHPLGPYGRSFDANHSGERGCDREDPDVVLRFGGAGLGPDERRVGGGSRLPLTRTI